MTRDAAVAIADLVLGGRVAVAFGLASILATTGAFYLQSRGLSEEEAITMVVSGFIEPLVRELPMEYAVEMNRLIQLQMEGSIG